MSEGSSPEEKLLRLIRNKKSAPGREEKISSPEKKKGQTVARLAGDLSQVFKNAEKFLIVAIVLLAGYLGYELMFGKRVERISVSADAGVQQNLEEGAAEKTFKTEPFEVYAGKLRQRDIFESLITPKPVKPVAPPQPLPGKEEKLKFTKMLKVVGIVLDENSEAIIEDVDNHRTFFLHTGDNIAGAVIKEILENKVILLYNGETIELIP